MSKQTDSGSVACHHCSDFPLVGLLLVADLELAKTVQVDVV